jgi:hypothetical protein
MSQRWNELAEQADKGRLNDQKDEAVRGNLLKIGGRPLLWFYPLLWSYPPLAQLSGGDRLCWARLNHRRRKWFHEEGFDCTTRSRHSFRRPIIGDYAREQVVWTDPSQGLHAIIGNAADTGAAPTSHGGPTQPSSGLFGLFQPHATA